jgi:hypothetical protein
MSFQTSATSLCHSERAHSAREESLLRGKELGGQLKASDINYVFKANGFSNGAS